MVMVMDTWRHKPCICEYPTYCRAARVIIKSTLVILTYWNGFCFGVSQEKGAPINFHQLHTQMNQYHHFNISVDTWIGMFQTLTRQNLSVSMKSNKFLLAIWVISKFLRFLVVLLCEMSTVWGHAWSSWWSGDCQMIIDFSKQGLHIFWHVQYMRIWYRHTILLQLIYMSSFLETSWS